MRLAALSDAPAPAANALPRAGVAARPHRAPLACSADPDQSARSATGQALFLMPLFALWPDFQSALKRANVLHKCFPFGDMRARPAQTGAAAEIGRASCRERGDSVEAVV